MVRELKVRLNVLVFEVHQREDDMGLLWRNGEVFQSSGGSDDCFHVEGAHEFDISRCVEVSQQHCARPSLRVSRQDHVIGFVVLLSIIIMEHLFIIAC